MKWVLAVAAFVLGALLWLITAGKFGGGRKMAGTELAAASAKASAKRDTVISGRATAVRKVEREHAITLGELREKEAIKARRLRGNAGELAAFLVRAGRRS